MRKILIAVILFMAIILASCNKQMIAKDIIVVLSENYGVVEQSDDVEKELDDYELSENKLDDEDVSQEDVKIEGDDTVIYNEQDVEKSADSKELQKEVDISEDTEKKEVGVEEVIVPKDNINNESGVNTEIKEDIIKLYNTSLPDGLVGNIKYDYYEMPKDYVLVLYNGVNIREEPTTKSSIINKAYQFEKMNIVAELKGEFLEKYENDIWYKVMWRDKDEVWCGYIFSSLAEPRRFQFDKMYDSINKLKLEVDNNKTAYIENFRNRNGQAPLYSGQTVDKFGVRRYQSAPAYNNEDPNWGFRYIPDGTLVSIVGETDKCYKIRIMDVEKEYFVPKRYISFRDSIEELSKVVVVDRENQNEGVFEFIDGKWNIISCTFATTGANSAFKQPTDLGYFMVMGISEYFLYLDDITNEIDAYAPYTIRFNGGAYIHGVPINFADKENRVIDLDKQEYLFTIGTIPFSHKCVRNYTSHAKFLYGWIEIGKSAVVVIE